MNYQEVMKYLRENAEEKYSKFSTNLNPGVTNLLGVRVPKLRAIAKEIATGEYREFLDNCKFVYYEEKMLFGLVIAYVKCPLEKKLCLLDEFIPIIDNWSVNDSVAMTIKIKKSEKEMGLDFIKKHLYVESVYPRRFAIVLLFRNYIDELHIDYVLHYFTNCEVEDYYVKMAVAWGLCECVIHYPEKSIQAISDVKMNKDLLKKIAQKCRDSFRVSQENKNKLTKIYSQY